MSEDAASSPASKGSSPSLEAPEHPTEASEDKRICDPFEVTLLPHEHPQARPLTQRWIAVITICLGGVCAAIASSCASFTEIPAAREFGVGREVTILAISLYVMGLGLGPLVSAPLSDVIGRRAVYLGSFSLFFIFSWPVAFAPHIAVFLVFRFVTGFCASAFFSVAGGSVSDMFYDDNVTTFVNQHLDWRWTYHILTIFSFVMLIALALFVPETLLSIVLKHKAQRLRKDKNDDRYWAPVERSRQPFRQRLLQSCTTPFLLLLHEPMVLLIDLWNALILGILYLTFQAFPIVFDTVHGFSTQLVGLTFLGITLGMLLGLLTQPFWTSLYHARKAALNPSSATKLTDPPPETHLLMGQPGGILVAVSLFWLAFTTYKSVPWPVPVIASIPFGTGIYFVFTSSFTYLVVAYRPEAAAAMAGNSAMRFSFAAGFPLFAGAMYARLGTVGATALLAGLTAIMAPLPFVFYRYGARLRARSKFAMK